MRRCVLGVMLAVITGCGGAGPAVELSSPTMGEVISTSDGRLEAATTISGFTPGTASSCSGKETPCGPVFLVIDGRQCGTVDSAAATEKVTIVSECALSEGTHTVKCQLYDHTSGEVIAESDDVEIEVRIAPHYHAKDDDDHKDKKKKKDKDRDDKCDDDDDD